MMTIPRVTMMMMWIATIMKIIQYLLYPLLLTHTNTHTNTHTHKLYLCCWNDGAGQVFGLMRIVQSRKHEQAAADLIVTRSVLSGQLVVFGTAAVSSCLERKINCIMLDSPHLRAGWSCVSRHQS